MGRLPAADYVFVTENAWVAEQAIKFLKRKKLFNDGEVPPALSEKYLAGLLWALYGGKGSELTQHLLLANCAAALEPRSDVINQLHRFLNEIDEKQAEVFNALMTEERAGQYAMQLTLGDSAFITKDNAPVILEQIKKSQIERYEAERNIEIETIQKAHKKELSGRDASSKKLSQELLDAKSENLGTRSELSDTKKRVEQIEEALEEEKRIRIDEKRRLVEKCIRTSIRYEKKVYFLIGFIVALVTGSITWFGFLNSQVLYIKASAVAVVSVLAILFFWKIPDFMFMNWVHNQRDKKFKNELDYLGLLEDVSLFDVDWKLQRAILPKKGDASI